MSSRETGHNAHIGITSQAHTWESAIVTLTADDADSSQEIPLQSGVSSPGISVSGDMLNVNTGVLMIPRVTTAVRKG